MCIPNVSNIKNVLSVKHLYCGIGKKIKIKFLKAIKPTILLQ